MEIKPKIEENIPIKGNNSPIVENSRLSNKKAFSSSIEMPDFEACLQELDENKKNSAEEQISPQIPVQSLNQADKKPEIAVLQLDGKPKEKKSLKINELDDLKIFMKRKEFFKHSDKDIKINLDNFKKEDIVFFKTCLENPSVIINNLNSQNFQATLTVQNQDNQVSYKSLNVSKGLFNLIENSFKTQKPVRVDFNGNSSVILKMNNDGKLIAEFISNDKAMEYILKSNIPGLKDKLDSEGIPYEEISYKDSSKNNNKRQNKGGNQ